MDLIIKYEKKYSNIYVFLRLKISSNRVKPSWVLRQQSMEQRWDWSSHQQISEKGKV